MRNDTPLGHRTVGITLALGALWGFVETTLGFGLHLLRQFTFLPGLTAYVLFPIGFFIMLAAVRQSGSAWAALGVAGVAALIKLTSGFLPQVRWIFVINPTISILAEGAVVAAGAALFAFRRSSVAIPKALLLSVAWRAIFLGLVLVLPTQKGILIKGTEALLMFVFLDSAINAILIGGALRLGADTRRLRSFGRYLATPVGVAAALVLAVGAELLISAVPV